MRKSLHKSNPFFSSKSWFICLMHVQLCLNFFFYLCEFSEFCKLIPAHDNVKTASANEFKVFNTMNRKQFGDDGYITDIRLMWLPSVHINRGNKQNFTVKRLNWNNANYNDMFTFYEGFRCLIRNVIRIKCVTRNLVWLRFSLSSSPFIVKVL